MITYLHSVMCITAAGATMLPVLARKAKSIERMRQQVNEDLQYRANRLMRGPGSERVSDEKLWSELGGLWGAWGMLRQAQLMNGIATEGRKQGKVREEDADTLSNLLNAVMVNFRLTVGELLTVKEGDPRRHARALVESYIKTGESFDAILGLLDGQSNCLFTQ